MRRALLMVLLLGVVAAGATANLRWLLSEVYAWRAAEADTAYPRNSVSLAASDIASRLAPWRTERHADYAWRLRYSGERLLMLREQVEALRWAPSDPYRWIELERTLAVRLDFGPVTELAAASANRLAPHSPAIQAEHARLGVLYWVQGSEALQAQWLSSMGFMLRRNRLEFLDALSAANRTPVFCLGPAPLLGLDEWCEAAAAAQ